MKPAPPVTRIRIRTVIRYSLIVIRGSNKTILLKMVSIACERRPHANKGRYPGVQGLGRPEIPGPPQEVSDQVPHTFDGIRCARQPQVRGHLIGSVMIKIPKKFTDRHLHL